MKVPDGVEEIASLDGDGLWEALCLHYYANDVSIDAISDHHKSNGTTGRAVKLLITNNYPDGTRKMSSIWEDEEVVRSIYKNYCIRESFKDNGW